MNFVSFGVKKSGIGVFLVSVENGAGVKKMTNFGYVPTKLNSVSASVEAGVIWAQGQPQLLFEIIAIVIFIVVVIIIVIVIVIIISISMVIVIISRIVHCLEEIG